VPGNAWRGQP